MNIGNIKKGLSEYDNKQVEIFCNYIQKESVKQKFLQDKKDEYFINEFIFINNKSDGKLFIDGKHITIQFRGLSIDYIALKNLMLIKYPETKIDIQLAYSGDEIKFGKTSGKIEYEHKIADPFNRSEKDIIGGYVVIKNQRGEFLTTLNLEEIQKHKKCASTSKIWDSWYSEMILKTLIKKAVKMHFDDIFEEIIEKDNETDNDIDNVENVMDLDLDWKKEIDNIGNLEDLKNYYLKNQGKGKAFSAYVTKRKSQILEKK